MQMQALISKSTDLLAWVMRCFWRVSGVLLGDFVTQTGKQLAAGCWCARVGII
jgi:hypothetical protein